MDRSLSGAGHAGRGQGQLATQLSLQRRDMHKEGGAPHRTLPSKALQSVSLSFCRDLLGVPQLSMGLARSQLPSFAELRFRTVSISAQNQSPTARRFVRLGLRIAPLCAIFADCGAYEACVPSPCMARRRRAEDAWRSFLVLAAATDLRRS
jgi:hypothetical protein